MTGPQPRPASPAVRRIGPFAAFGLVAALAIIGAVWEMSYYASSPVLSSGSLGTTLGIVAAAIVFFAIALTARSND
jgi:hypothetical protein